MLTERLTAIKNWVKEEIEWQKEANRFHKVFGFGLDPNGILTKPGEEMRPLSRGLITSRLSFSSMRKIIKREDLPEEDPTKYTYLYIYTRPLDDSKINAKFSRLNLWLWTTPKETD